MNTEIVPIQRNAIQQTQITPDQIELLKRTICKGASDDELKLFLHVANKSGLDPFARQIHAVKRWNAKDNREQMTIQVGIDGFRLIADRTGLYAGSDDPVYDDEKKPSKATVTVYKMIQGQRCPFTATARWTEYCPGSPNDFMWKKMPCLMIGKVAESLALRKAFPAELSGLYTNEEMEQAAPRAVTLPSGTVSTGVRPENPSEEDFPTQDHGYYIDFGKWNRKTLEQIYRDFGPDAIGGYINFLEESAKKKGQAIDPNGKVAIFIKNAEAFLGAMENGEPA